MNAVDDLWNDRNVESLRVADQCDGKTSNPGGPPIEDIGVADDLDLGWCRCGVCEGLPVDRRNVRLAVLASTLALIDGSGVGRLDDQLA